MEDEQKYHSSIGGLKLASFLRRNTLERSCGRRLSGSSCLHRF